MNYHGLKFSLDDLMRWAFAHVTLEICIENVCFLSFNLISPPPILQDGERKNLNT